MGMLKLGFPYLLYLLYLMAMPAHAAESPLPMRQLAPGLFLYQGLQEEASAANEGAIANAGFIVGKRCVAVIDTGGSLANGQRLRLAIRRETSLPVCFVINTHVHPDHVYGNAAFAADAPDAPVYIGHAHLAAAMQARSGAYRRLLSRQLGETAASASVLVPPTMTLSAELSVDLGDRVLQLHAWPTAHTDSDVTVFDIQSGAMWLGDLLFEGRVPALDGSLKGWLDVMENLRGLPVRLAVPGHGAPGSDWPGALRSQERYLQALLLDVRQAIRDKKTLAQTVDSAAMQERPNWLLFDEYHARNVTAAYTELEWEN
ncbi:MAG: beta-lactamase domain protein [Burkholderia sp.]|nr:beta-lactamase domain protein [Burkholderia sp.]